MILRYDVPVDDQEHQITCGAVLHVDCRESYLVTFWADDFQPHNHTFRVLATGQPIDDGWVHVGTGLSPGDNRHRRGHFVWHLLELATP